jgi:hypothetical protein
VSVTLDELILARKRALGLSYQRMAARAVRAGHEITGSAIATMVKRPLSAWPLPSTVRALAAALDVAEDEVIAAATRSLGFRDVRVPMDDPRVQAWLSLTGDRSPEQVEALLEIVKIHLRALDLSPRE